MAEPTQEVIVAEVTRRGRAYMADILHVLGPSWASILPDELQRMKATGLVDYDEPLGPNALLRLPQA